MTEIMTVVVKTARVGFYHYTSQLLFIATVLSLKQLLDKDI